MLPLDVQLYCYTLFGIECARLFPLQVTSMGEGYVLLKLDSENVGVLLERNVSEIV